MALKCICFNSRWAAWQGRCHHGVGGETQEKYRRWSCAETIFVTEWVKQNKTEEINELGKRVLGVDNQGVDESGMYD